MLEEHKREAMDPEMKPLMRLRIELKVQSDPTQALSQPGSHGFFDKDQLIGRAFAIESKFESKVANQGTILKVVRKSFQRKKNGGEEGVLSREQADFMENNFDNYLQKRKPLFNFESDMLGQISNLFGKEIQSSR